MTSLAATTLLDRSQLAPHLPALTRIAIRIAGSREAGEDLVQDTFERILRSPRRLTGDPFAYLVRALRNRHIDRVRADRRRFTTTTIDDALAWTLAAPDHTATQRDARAVLEAVAALPDTFRAVIACVDVAGYSYAETAERLDIPVGTVMSRLHRGRRQVIDALDPQP